MPHIALKVDVDTLRGTRNGALRLAEALECHHCHATFLFSVGPDHTGRALRRVFQAGFVGKVRRTSVVRHYGIPTLLYGTLLPGPHIGRRARGCMRAIARAGFETGLHAYDHVRWQDGVANAGRAWARRELALGIEAYTDALEVEPKVHGAAGWRVNEHVPELEREFGFRIASDTRGRGPFLPVVAGVAIEVPQLPTTLPTLDELLGQRDLQPADPIEYLLALTQSGCGDHVYTLHAEIEGGDCLGRFEALLAGWRAQGYEFTSLGESVARCSLRDLPRCEIVSGRVQGRAGLVAMQGAEIVQ
jgi:peptidoglycan/xylan/chitin deacetylase (PgdA/CDA1 family)